MGHLPDFKNSPVPNDGYHLPDYKTSPVPNVARQLPGYTKQNKKNRDLIKNKTKMVRAMEPGSDNGTHVQIQGKGLFKRLATLVPLLTT